MELSSLEGAHREVRLRLQSVRAPQWALPTPCEGWSVSDLVRHLAVGATMARHILSGDPWTREAVVEEVSSVSDLRAEWEWRTAEERAGFATFGALERAVTHPVMGDIPCSQFLRDASRRCSTPRCGTWRGRSVRMISLPLSWWSRSGPPCRRSQASSAKVASSARDRAAKSAKTHRCRIGYSTFPDVVPNVAEDLDQFCCAGPAVVDVRSAFPSD